ncbi:MAG: response regulator [Acidobacteriota bacterium]|nr:response regulator [Acidobacteriota bacterium]
MTSADSVSRLPHAILLVDDNLHGSVARRRVLLDLGYLVETAACAEEALRIIAEREHRFDVVVTDFKMISMDGVQLIARLKQISPDTRTILLSGFVEPLGMTEASTGADAVIPKCATEVGQLTRTVKNLLTRRVEKKPPASVKRAAASVVKSV